MFLRLGILAAVLFLTLPRLSSQVDRPQPDRLDDDEFTLHVLSRLTFGVTPTLVEEVRKQGLERWLDDQLRSRSPQPELAQRLERYGSLGIPTRQIYERYQLPAPPDETPEERRKRERLAELPYSEIRCAIIWQAIESKAMVHEMMAEFWRNHFNIDQRKDAVGFSGTEWEQTIIRGHTFGRFGEFLLATAQHPAMLGYLDNVVSRRPPNKTELKAIGRVARQRTGSRERGLEAIKIAEQNGLNENYARELLELHTLGVDNGYSQKDVIALAEALTGWTVDTSDRRFTFLYRDDMHVEGDKYVLGQSFQREKRRNGMAEGEGIIEMLAQHPNTAEFLARKLSVFLVDDDPPEAFVKSVAKELKRSKFDLAGIVKYIALSDEMRRRSHYRSKFKTPFEFIASAVRICDGRVLQPERLQEICGEMGQPIYGCEDPTGYRDTAESWRDPGVMAVRWRFALALAANKVEGVEIPDSFFDDVRGQGAPVVIARLCKRILPAGMRNQTIKALFRVAGDHARLVADKKAVPVPLERRILGVLLGSPEFQEQ